MEHQEHNRLDPPPGDWLFRLRGEIWGPVPSTEIIQRMHKGEVDEATEISTGEGDWKRLQSVPAFLPFLYQAKAAIRAARARAEAEQAARRRRSINIVKIAVGAVVLGLLSFATIYFLLVHQPWAGGANLTAWASKHVPLFGIPTAKASQLETATRDDMEAQEDNGINIEQILIEDAPSLVAIQSEGKKTRTIVKRPNGRSKEAKAERAEPEGKVASIGGLSNEEITQVVYSRSNLSRLFGCVRDELRRNPDLNSPVTMSFTINNDGNVGEVRMDDFNMDGGTLHQCFKQRLSSLKFRAYSGERKNIEIPFNFNR